MGGSCTKKPAVQPPFHNIPPWAFGICEDPESKLLRYNFLKGQLYRLCWMNPVMVGLHTPNKGSANEREGMPQLMTSRAGCYRIAARSLWMSKPRCVFPARAKHQVDKGEAPVTQLYRALAKFSVNLINQNVCFDVEWTHNELFRFLMLRSSRS